MSSVGKYLKNHAEPECLALADLPSGLNYKHCLIIPAYDETANFTERLIRPSGLLQKHHGLAIVVINRPDDRANPDTNIALEQQLKKDLPLLWENQNLCLVGNDHWGILLVDRHRTPIPRKQGVGLARKIACDLAVSLIDQGLIISPWIHSTDADAKLPENYFDLIAETTSQVALLYPYQHDDTDDDISRATRDYEQSLHYYVDGLRRAGSPYAFHTLGSIIAFHFERYCQVRGFPKRAGGEDFYLLNKLAKLGTFYHPQDIAANRIILQPRVSHRVPFGTGPAVEKLLANSQEAQTDYHPDVFARLRELLDLIQTNADQNLGTATIQRLPQESINALESLGIDSLWQHLKGRTTTEQQKHFHLWFDGFRTLKFIHYLQQYHYPPQQRAVIS